MIKKLLVAAGLTLAFGAPALADTPIGTGVTGAGGTGANQSDSAATGVRPGGEAQVRRPEGSEPISGAVKGEAAATQERSRGDAAAAPSAQGRATHPSAPTAAPTGRGTTGNTGPTGTVGGGRPSVPAAPN